MCCCFCRLLLEAVLQQSYVIAADAKGSGACGIHADIAGVPRNIRCIAADALGTGAA